MTFIFAVCRADCTDTETNPFAFADESRPEPLAEEVEPDADPLCLGFPGNCCGPAYPCLLHDSVLFFSLSLSLVVSPLFLSLL